MRQWRRVSFWFVVFSATMTAILLVGLLAVVLRVPS